LRLVLSYKGGKILLKRDDNGEMIVGKKTKNVLEYLFEIPNTYENETFVLTVEYPSFEPYTYTGDEKSSIADMVSNDTSSSSNKGKTTAAEKVLCESDPTRKYNTAKTDELLFGCGNSKCCKKLMADPTRRFAIIGQYESKVNKARKQAFDTSINRINGIPVNLDIGPPRYGDVKKSTVFKKLVEPNNLSKLDSNMMWVWDKDNTKPNAVFNIIMPVSFVEPTFPADNIICPRGPLVSTLEAQTRLRAGACDKLVNNKEQRPGTYTDDCIKSLFLRSGCMLEGLAYPRTPDMIRKLSYKQVKGPPGKAIDILNHLLKVLPQLSPPAGIDEPLQPEMIKNSYDSANKNNTLPVWLRDMEELLLQNRMPYIPPMVSSDDALLDEDIITEIQKVKETADTPYQRGMDVTILEKANMDCYGKFEFNPCAGPNEATGPHTMECLDFLFKNSGKKISSIGPTYKQSSDRTSGTDRIPEKPIMYCTRKGKLSPLDDKGNVNMDSLQKANSQGGVTAVRKFYDDVHRKANYSLDKDTQYRAMNDCYGLIYDKTGNCPEGESALDDPTRIPDGSEFKLSPAISPGSKVININGAVVTQSNIPIESIDSTLFISKALPDNENGHIYVITKKGPPAGGYLVIDGFKVKLLKFADTFDFKQRATWAVINSVAGNPGEVSIESVSKPGFFLYFNKIDRSINISNDTSLEAKQAQSFALM
jgi:hypothetical protein